MRLILCLKRGADPGAFLREARAAGVRLAPLRGLPRHFTLEGQDLRRFPLTGHPAIAEVEDGDAPARGAADQAIVIGAAMQGGSWGIARHIRRDAPWLRGPRIRHPIVTGFRALRTGSGVDVYIVDTGIRYSHAEFGGRASFVGGVYGAGGVDDNWHGTAVAGCLAGASTGIARAAGLRIVKGLNSANAGTVFGIATCIGMARDDYLARAATNRPAVLNLSLVANGTTVTSAVAECIDAGMVVVACAANDLSATVPIPGSVADVICVGGIKANDTPYYDGATGTNFGSRVDILAASERVWTASYAADDGYWLAGGTSIGTPLAAGVLACMLQGKSRLISRAQVQAVRTALLASATTGRLVPQPQFGIGELPDRILWLDPDAADEAIPGVT